MPERSIGQKTASLVALTGSLDRRIISTRYFSIVTWPNGFWFRLFDYGLSVRRFEPHGLMFSERNGYTRYVRAFGWIARILTPKSA